MSAALFEGLRSLLLPCSLTLILPIAAIALGPRRPVPAALTGGAGAVTAMWLRAAGITPGARWVAIALAVLTLGVIAIWWRAPERQTGRRVLVALVPGFLAGWLWQPCVGEVLGDILQRAATRSAPSALLLMSYALGVLLPAFAMALARVAFGDPPRMRIVLRALGTVVLAGFSLMVILGVESQVLGWLVVLST